MTKRDDTARRPAEALPGLSRRFEALLQTVPDIIAEVDVNKVYTWVNAAGREFFGDDVVGREAAHYFVGPQDTYEHVEPLFRGDPNVVYVESWQRRQDGQARLLAWWCRNLIDEDGDVVGVLSTARDVTDERRAEQELRRLNEELERRVRERTAELLDANKELEAFAYTISHDLRAPLRAIAGFAGIVARRHRAALDEEGRRYIDNVVQAAERMDLLIRDLLTHARLGRSGVSTGVVSLDALLAELAQEKGLQLREIGAVLEVQPDLPAVLGDRSLLGQIFGNLIENAITYRREDEPLKIRVFATAEGESITVRVADNGIGIAPEHHEKIFEIFQRLHAEYDYPGTGVGLANVKKAAGLLGGRVWVESSPQQGSTFFVELRKG